MKKMGKLGSGMDSFVKFDQGPSKTARFGSRPLLVGSVITSATE